jgi:hypothetical protein
LLGEEEIENLSRLIISGDGNSKEELQALKYILGRGYSNLTDATVVKIGDWARMGWFVTSALMGLFSLSWIFLGW